MSYDEKECPHGRSYLVACDACESEVRTMTQPPRAGAGGLPCHYAETRRDQLWRSAGPGSGLMRAQREALKTLGMTDLAQTIGAVARQGRELTERDDDLASPVEDESDLAAWTAFAAARAANPGSYPDIENWAEGADAMMAEREKRRGRSPSKRCQEFCERARSLALADAAAFLRRRAEYGDIPIGNIEPLASSIESDAMVERLTGPSRGQR